MPDDNLAVFRQWIEAYRRWDVDWMVEHVTEAKGAGSRRRPPPR